MATEIIDPRPKRIGLTIYRSEQAAKEAKDPDFPEISLDWGVDITDHRNEPYQIADSSPQNKFARYISSGVVLVFVGSAQLGDGLLSLMANLPEEVAGKHRIGFEQSMAKTLDRFKNLTREDTQTAAVLGGYIGSFSQDFHFHPYYKLIRHRQIERIVSWVQQQAGIPIATLIPPKTHAYRTDVYLSTQKGRLIVLQDGK